jgi:hypothetical protein
MTDSTLAAGNPGLAPPATVAELAQRIPGFIQGARWFWWIAGLSLANVVCDLANADINFVLGLAFTQIIRAMFASSTAIALVLDALLIGGFFLVGLHAQKGRVWAFALGVVVYVCDALVFVKFADWMPVAFHALALFYIGKAFMSLQAAKKATGIR